MIAYPFRPDEQPAWNNRGPDVLDYVTQWFAGEGAHEGMDFGLALGTPLHAGAAGAVVDVVYGWGGGWGNHVVVAYASFQVRYAHMHSIDVTIGDQVLAGSRLGTSGNSGASTGPHLHLEVRTGFIRGAARGRPVDPRLACAGQPPANPSAPPPIPNPPTEGPMTMTADERKWLEAKFADVKAGALAATVAATNNINGNVVTATAKGAQVVHHSLDELAQRPELGGRPLAGFTVNI